jgi:ribosomal protein S27AE
MVLNWLEDNKNTFENTVTKKFKKCEACGADFSKDCLQIEVDGEWIRVYCGSCGFLISKHYSPKAEL